MSPSSSPTTPRLRLLHIALLGACAALAACGGGQTDAGTESAQAAQEVNAADGDAATNEEYGVGANASAVESDAAAFVSASIQPARSYTPHRSIFT